MFSVFFTLFFVSCQEDRIHGDQNGEYAKMQVTYWRLQSKLQFHYLGCFIYNKTTEKLMQKTENTLEYRKRPHKMFENLQIRKFRQKLK